MRAFLLKFSAALNIHERGGYVREMAFRIVAGGIALRLDKDSPAGAEPAECVVQSPGDANEFGRHRGIQIRSPKLRGSLKRTILVEDDALVDQSSPGQEVRKLRGRAPIFPEVHHRASYVQMAGDTQVAAHNVDELWVALCRPHCGRLTCDGEQEAGEP